VCVCTIAGPNDSKLSIWILEDYGTNNWALKHTISTWILFGRINIRFGFVDWVAKYIVIIVHPKWNMISFAGEDGTIITYDMDRRRVHVIPALVFLYVRHSIQKEFNCRLFHLSYVPLFFELLAEQYIKLHLMYLSVMHFKLINIVCLSMDMLISSMIDVIISAKLVCHLCFVCKLNYLFGAHMRYCGVTIIFQHQWLL
jgi:hypothetical protein